VTIEEKVIAETRLDDRIGCHGSFDRIRKADRSFAEVGIGPFSTPMNWPMKMSRPGKIVTFDRSSIGYCPAKPSNGWGIFLRQVNFCYRVREALGGGQSENCSGCRKLVTFQLYYWPEPTAGGNCQL
jgi:hypothetical protein